MANIEIQDEIINIFSDFDNFIESIVTSSNKKFSPPFTKYYDENHDIIYFLNSFFKNYLLELKSFDRNLIYAVNYSMKQFIEKHSKGQICRNFDFIEECTQLCNMIIEVLQYNFAGRPFDAFEVMEKVMMADNFHLTYLLPTLQFHGVLFRVRKGTGYTERKELFHTPFHLREKCASYRYSLLGYPSLYLAGSIETALKETNVTDKNFTCSGFSKNEGYKFIDLSLPTKRLDFSDKYCLLVFYPLIVACGLKVKKNDCPFKPEYVVSQLLFQYIRLHYSGFDGIAYASTKNDKIDYQSIKNKNFVIYVKHTEQEMGFSEETGQNILSSIPITQMDKESLEEFENRIRKSDFETIM